MTPPEQALSAPPAMATDRGRGTSASPALSVTREPDAGDIPPPAWYERIRDRWNTLVSRDDFQRWTARFPLTRPITRHRSKALFDIVSGFVYTQTLLACVELELFEYLSHGPRTAREIADHTGLSEASTARLLHAAASLRLLVRRRHGRFAIGPLSAPLVGNTGVLALIRHHRMAYADLADPVALLRKGSASETELSKYWSYASYDETPQPDAVNEKRVAAYSEIMAATLPPVAHDVLDAYDLSRHRCLMDVGGGEGVFLSHVAERHPHLRLELFDLPAVAARAQGRLTQAGHGSRTACHGGNFHADALPTGADVISLVRVLLDHDDAAVLGLLTRVRQALPPGGTLLIAEALAGARGAETVGDAYFAFYLLAMGKGRARRPEELHWMLQQAGFRSSRELPTRFPIQTGLIVAQV